MAGAFHKHFKSAFSSNIRYALEKCWTHKPISTPAFQRCAIFQSRQEIEIFTMLMACKNNSTSNDVVNVIFLSRDAARFWFVSSSNWTFLSIYTPVKATSYRGTVLGQSTQLQEPLSKDESTERGEALFYWGSCYPRQIHIIATN